MLSTVEIQPLAGSRNANNGKKNQNKTKQKILKLILSFFVYAKFGIAIFITFRLSNIANAIEAIENTTADIKIILNEVADGK